MFDLSWHNIIHSNTINFLFLAVILGWICIPKLKNAIENMAEKTANSVNSSIESRKQALINLEDTKIDYARTPEEKENIKNIALNTLNSLEQKAKEDTEKAKKVLIANSEKAIKNEISKINSSLIKEMAQSSVNTAFQDICSKLSQDESLHDRLIEQSINDLDKA